MILNGMKKGLTLLLVLCLCLSTVPVFAASDSTVSINSKIVYTEETDIDVLIEDIVDELKNAGDKTSVKYSFRLDLGNTTKNFDFLTTLQLPIIEHLEGVLTITPSISLSVQSDTATVLIEKHKMNKDYEETLNTIIEEGRKQTNDYEVIHYLGNYLHSNGFLYNYDAFTVEGIKSSNIINSKDCMPDGVLSTKLGVATGYANLMSDYLEGVGIPSIKMRGYNGNGYHVWNMAYIDIGEGFDWYCIDTVNSLFREYSPTLITGQHNFPVDVVWVDGLLESCIDLKYTDVYLLEYAYNNYFTDIDGHWGRDNIVKLYVRDMVNGYEDRTYRPDNNITIAEFLQISIASCVPKSERENTEVWYDGVYNYALNHGIINPLLFPESNLMNNITREEMAYILVKIDEIVKENEPVDVVSDFIIRDDSDILEIYKTEVYQSYLKGFIVGTDSLGTFNPKGLATRAEVATIISRMLAL